jgi:hypothetical protein
MRLFSCQPGASALSGGPLLSFERHDLRKLLKKGLAVDA